MRLRTLAVLPFLVAVGFAVIDLIFFEDSTNALFRRIQIESARLLWIIGTLAAALKFKPGDYLRRAWMLQALFMAILLFRDLLYLFKQAGFDIFQDHYRLCVGIIVLIANLSGVIGMWLLARAWRVADLKLPGPKWGQQLILLIAILLSLAIAGPAAWKYINMLLDGDVKSLAGLASSLGDIISFCLIAPLLLTAIALHGGLLEWPWALITASSIGWLFYDATLLITYDVEQPTRAALMLNEFCRTLSCVSGFSAGMAQRFVVQKIRKELG